MRRRLQVKVKVSQVAFSWILVEVNHLGVRNLRMVNHLCVSDQVEVKTEGSEAGQNELRIAALFDELNIY